MREPRRVQRLEIAARRGVAGPFRGCLAGSGRTSGVERHQVPLGNDEVGQPEQAEQLRLVLGQPLVANLLVPEQVLDHMERVLDLRTDAGLELLGPLEQLRPLARRVQLASLARLHGHVPFRTLSFFSLVHAAVSRITESVNLIPVQQRAGLRHVVDVGRRGDHRVHQPRLGIHADVRLHPEVPLVALLGLVHIGVARLVLVLGRTGRGDDGRIDDRAGAHQQPLLAQVRVDLVEQRPREVVGLQQAAELQQRRGVGHRLARQVDAHEVAQRLAVVQRILQRLVGQAVPLLQAVHAQHPGNPDRLATNAPALGVQRLNHRHQPRPRHDALHLAEELLAPRELLLHRVLGAGKAALGHGRSGQRFDPLTHARVVPDPAN